MDLGKKWLVDVNAQKTQLVSFDRSYNNGSIDKKMDRSALEEKSSFKMLGLSFSSKLDWGSSMISIAKTASRKIGAFTYSMKFLSPGVTLYLYTSTIQPMYGTLLSSLGSCSYPSCYLELLEKLQNQICRPDSSSLAASLKPLAHQQNVTSLAS